MKIYITLRENDSGIVKKIQCESDYESVYEYWGRDHEAAKEAIIFYYTEGNMGCDCNRKLDFYDHKIDAENEAPCTEGKYDLLKIESDELGVIYDPE
jgi:hypothetical protein